MSFLSISLLTKSKVQITNVLFSPCKFFPDDCSQHLKPTNSGKHVQLNRTKTHIFKIRTTVPFRIKKKKKNYFKNPPKKNTTLTSKRKL